MDRMRRMSAADAAWNKLTPSFPRRWKLSWVVNGDSVTEAACGDAAP
jgi:hypothetical protein